MLLLKYNNPGRADARPGLLWFRIVECVRSRGLTPSARLSRQGNHYAERNPLETNPPLAPP